MKTFVASSLKVEVNGETIYSVVDGMGAFTASANKILSDNGINNPEPGKWYNQQAWLNSFKQIAEKVGKITLFNIGLKIPENAIFPPEIDNIHKALASIDVAYHMNHRGGEIGYYKYEQTGEYSGIVTCNNPYPDEFDKGIITAMCRKFVTNHVLINVFIDQAKPIRSKGDDSTTYKVSWQ
jgi:hypothetical protein